MYISSQRAVEQTVFVTEVACDMKTGLIAWGQTDGQIKIATIINREDFVGLMKIKVLYNLHEHKSDITALVWNSKYNVLASGDKKGKVVIWSLSNEKWIPSLINDDSKEAIVSINVSHDGKYFGIYYENGVFVCSDPVDGTQKWKVSLTDTHSFFEWDHNSKSLYTGIGDHKLILLESKGLKQESVDLGFVENDFLKDTIVCHKVNSSSEKMYLVCYASGRVIISSHSDSTEPILVYTDMKLHYAAWSSTGEFFVVAGYSFDGQTIIRLYTKEGTFLRTLHVPGSLIRSISFTDCNTSIVLGLQHSIISIQIVPAISYAYTESTLIYSITSHSNVVIYTNSKTGETHYKTINNLVGITAHDGHVAIVTQKQGECNIVITDTKGLPSISNMICPFKAKFLNIFKNYCVVSTIDKVCVWDFMLDKALFFTSQNTITAISTKNYQVFVATRNHEIIVYDIRTLQEVSKFHTGIIVELIDVNSDASHIAMSDSVGRLCFMDIYSGLQREQSHSESWSLMWASDSPDLFVSLSNQKLFVYKSFTVLEPIMNLSLICEFNNLDIVTVNIIDLISNYEDNKRTPQFLRFEVKPVRDVIMLLKTDQYFDEVIQYIRGYSHPRLWSMLAEYALKREKYDIAKIAYEEGKISKGIIFMKILDNYEKEETRIALCNWFLGNFEKAAALFLESNETQLAQLVFKTEGNWRYLIKVSDDEKDVVQANTQIAHHALIKGDYERAIRYFGHANNLEEQIYALYKSDDHAGLSKIIDQLEEKDPLLEKIARYFIAMGSSYNATKAMLKYGKPEAACYGLVFLNKWKDALHLANRYTTVVDIRNVTKRYSRYLTDRGKHIKALKVLMAHKLFEEGSELLDKKGDEAFSIDRDYLLAKKYYLFAAKLRIKHATTGEAAPQTTMNNIWDRVDAVHYLMLAHRMFYNGQYENSIYAAARVLRVHKELIKQEIPAAVMALAGLQSSQFKACSLGLTVLECSRNLPQKKRDLAESIAVRIFTNNEPDDTEPVQEIDCPDCQRTLNFYTPKCRCGYVFAGSIVSGKPIVPGSLTWKCSNCSHLAYKEEMISIKACPLCHSKV